LGVVLPLFPADADVVENARVLRLFVDGLVLEERRLEVRVVEQLACRVRWRTFRKFRDLALLRLPLRPEQR
jgi:hypothetical protein